MIKLKMYDLFVVIDTSSISTKYKHTFLFQTTAFKVLNQ